MPIYEYQCQSCGECTEVLQNVNDAPETVCPSCDAEALRRLVSAPSFQLKGTGWYVTDFRDNDKKPDNEKSESAKASESKSNESTAGEVKAATAKLDGEI